MSYRWARAVLALVILAGVPALADAQSSDRRWVMGGGMFLQTAAPEFADALDFTAAGETGTIESTFTPKSSFGLDLSLAARVRGRFGVGASLSLYAPAQDSGASGALTARVPHPFVTNEHRVVSAPAGLKRKEMAVHTNLLYFAEPSARLRVIIGGGLSLFRADQTFVTGIEYHEDTASAPTTVTLDGIGHVSEAGTGVGVNGTLDVIWALNDTVGIGGLVRYSRGTASFDAGGRDVDAPTGGLHTGIGIRFLF